MKPVLSPQQAMELDRRTQAAGVAAAALMERAGRSRRTGRRGGLRWRLRASSRGRLRQGQQRRGRLRRREAPGAARDAGARRLDGDGRCAQRAGVDERALACGRCAFRRRRSRSPSLARELARADVAIDAVFGTGFRGVPEDEWASAIEVVERVTGSRGGGGHPVRGRRSHGNGGRRSRVGGRHRHLRCCEARRRLAPRGRACGHGCAWSTSDSSRRRCRRDVILVEPSDVAAVIPHRALESHKRASGVVVVVAGSRDMTGAPALIARAAARVGAGLVVVAVPAAVLPAVQATMTEAVFLGLPETDQGTVADDALEPALAALERADALAVGPGLTQHAETAGFVRDARAREPRAGGAGRRRPQRVHREGRGDRGSQGRRRPHAASGRVRTTDRAELARGGSGPRRARPCGWRRTLVR